MLELGTPSNILGYGSGAALLLMWHGNFVDVAVVNES
jgi:hypothetical protein